VAALAKAQQSPEQWLERIVQLRREGKHDEADRQLTEFRRAYPEYRLSEETKAKVERPGEPARAR
jgi:TolA-binding protein